MYVRVEYFGDEPYQRWDIRVVFGDSNFEMEFPALVAGALRSYDECLPVIQITGNAADGQELHRQVHYHDGSPLDNIEFILESPLPPIQ